MPNFRVVFTLPARIASIAYQNKALVYDLLFKASSEAVLTIAADRGRADRTTRRRRHAPLQSSIWLKPVRRLRKVQSDEASRLASIKNGPRRNNSHRTGRNIPLPTKSNAPT